MALGPHSSIRITSNVFLALPLPTHIVIARVLFPSLLYSKLKALHFVVYNRGSEINKNLPDNLTAQIQVLGTAPTIYQLGGHG